MSPRRVAEAEAVARELGLDDLPPAELRAAMAVLAAETENAVQEPAGAAPDH